MGVSGSGKSTVGKALARELELPYLDADDHHPDANVKKMSSGQPLNDADRQPWLEILSEILMDHEKKAGAILGCSALKSAYREILESKLTKPATFIYLKGSYELIKSRIEGRDNHFMPAALLNSQFRDLEEPEHAIEVSVDQSVADIVSSIINHL